MHRRLLALAALTCCVACGSASDDASGPSGVSPPPPGESYQNLSQWHLFSDGAAQLPNSGVEPYDVISPLFSDYTSKHRFLYLPPGAQIGYEADGKWRFPPGTVLIKTFAYSADLRDPNADQRLLETRLLVREADAWVPNTYIWNDAETEAVRKTTGATIEASFIDAQGQTRTTNYGVPNTNQCQECHGTGAELDTLGGRTRQLDRDQPYPGGGENQIDHLASLGWLDTTPPATEERTKLVDPFGSAPIHERARSYFDSNCGHCHSAGRAAAQSGLLLGYEHTDAATQPASNWGVCKQPTSAGGATCGLSLDVVPQDPDNSILLCRISSTNPQERMPPLASVIPHDEGIQLVRDWINAMQLAGCGP